MGAGEQLLDELRAMVPALRERGRGAEEAGRIPAATIAELQQAGAFRAVVPSAYGGLELDFPFIPQIFRILGRGCTSTAWCMGFLIYHNFQFAHFPKQAQDDVWSATGQTMAPGQVMPSGKARRVDGGFVIDGRWGYATGIQHGDWMLLSAPVEVADGAGEIRRFFVPVEQCAVLDTWHVSAMRATGSHDVEIDGLFVPEHRSIAVQSLREGTAPGLELNHGPLWRVPLLTFMSLGAVGPMVGAAEAMLELVAGTLKTKVGAYSGDSQQGLMTQRIRLARLQMELEATTHLWEHTINEVWDDVVGGVVPSREARARSRMVVAHTAARCHAIVGELAQAAGSRATYLESPIQRFHRDVSALATHALFEYDHIANLHGGVMLDVELPVSAMV